MLIILKIYILLLRLYQIKFLVKIINSNNIIFISFLNLCIPTPQYNQYNKNVIYMR